MWNFQTETVAANERELRWICSEGELQAGQYRLRTHYDQRERIRARGYQDSRKMKTGLEAPVRLCFCAGFLPCFLYLRHFLGRNDTLVIKYLAETQTL